MQRRIYMFAINQLVRRDQRNCDSHGTRSPTMVSMIQERLQRSYQVHMQRAWSLSSHHLYDELKVEKERHEAAQMLLVMRELSTALHQCSPRRMSRLSVVPEGDHEGEDPEPKQHRCLCINGLLMPIEVWRRHRCVSGAPPVHQAA